jgi:phosphoglycerol transferase MdoB-like AlkP superfamily enzyme
MRAYLAFFIRNFLFWLVLFEFSRAVFIVYHYQKAGGLISPLFAVFFHGLRLDVAAACYLLAIPFLLWCLSLLTGLRTLGAATVYHWVALTLVSLIQIIDLQLYREWGSKIGAQALFYMRFPQEALASSASSPILLLTSIFLVTLIAGMLAYNRWVKPAELPRVPNTYRQILKKAVTLLLLTFLLITGMRGGLQLAPVNQSSAYFSDIPFFNHAALNTIWNLADNVVREGLDKSNPYRFTSEKQAEETVSALFEKSGRKSEKILITERPNIVLIVMESFSADVIECLGGEKGICKGFEDLRKEGLLFTEFYASGDRTDKGLVAILSGFPAQPKTSIIKDPRKFEKLPMLSRPLKQAGYTPVFFYGGESEFVNIKAYLLNGGYAEIVDKRSFGKNEMNSKWGAHDHVLFARVSGDLKKVPQPFFATVLTLTNHEPFEVPGKKAFPVRNESDLFRNSAYYTDQSIKDFIEKNRKEDWFRKTLFVLVADHGHRLPRNNPDVTLPSKFHIPFLLFGDVIKPELRGKAVHRTASQTDIATTLLSQLGLSPDGFSWGKDLFDPDRKDFAFYSYNDGFGWITPDLKIVFDNGIKKVISPAPPESVPDQELFKARCYQQVLMERYLSY